MTVLHDEVVDRPFDEAPESPAKPDWKVAFGRAKAKFTQDQCTDLAAALTYFSVQSIFPGLIAVISLLNIFGDGPETTKAMVDSIANIAGRDPSELSAVSDVINTIQAAPGGGIALLIGIGGALWSASGYVGAFGRAMNRIYAVEEGRGFVKLKGTLLAITAIEVLLIILVMLSIVTSGGIARELGSVIGLGSTAVMIWDLAKWPFVAFIVIAIISMLYNYTPNVKRAKNRVFSSGAAVGFFVWVFASIALASYIGFTQGASYQKTYGAFAGAIIFLLWLWVTNIAMLFGAELDAELLRTKQLKSGLPAERLVLLPARDNDGIAKKQEADEKLVDTAIDLRLNADSSDDVLARHRSGDSADARNFGLAMGPSTHGRVSTPSAPVPKDKVAASRRLGQDDEREQDVRTGSGSDAKGSAQTVESEELAAQRAQVAADRAARRDEALTDATRRRKIRDRKAAQEAKVQAKEAELAKKREKELQAREEAIPLQQRWDAVEAVRAQYAPRSTPEREALQRERDARRASYDEQRREAAKKAAVQKELDEHAKRLDGGQPAVPAATEGPDTEPPAPSELQREIERERQARRDAWFAERGL